MSCQRHQVTASGRLDEDFDANVGRVQELSSWKSQSGAPAPRKGFLRFGCGPPS